MPIDQTRALSVAEIENQVASIWRDVLDVPPGEDGATFFELNGQSISAVRIVARVQEEIGVQVDLGDLFEDPNLATFTRDIVAKAQTLGR
ncbi:phosphopantetheine-binding protein [Phytohabitans sp. LJ34]|uniref:phosphopantetheine-binding protein n=1 Tax=Phytohabitans sp. LJ34 TaxID=3452217 RepID=UPI003F8ABB08